MIAEHDGAEHGQRHRHRARMRQVATVLARHGLAHLAAVSGLERLVPPRLHRPQAEGSPAGAAELREALAELGVTFIKLGQLLSTRPDLLPAGYAEELAKLQDAAPPEPAAVMRATIAAELGRPVEDVFATFDDEPLAAASIGQAHAATLADGAQVVVKVRRPGAVEQVTEDLEILRNLAAAAARRWEAARAYDLPGLAEEFAQTLRAELDYLQEARNAERFATNLAEEPGIHIPRVYGELTTSRVLVLERLRGLKIDDLAGLDAAAIDRPALARRAAAIEMRMVFEDGFVHADPHPGNFFIEADGTIGLIDFGMVTMVEPRTREHLADVLLALTRNDSDALVDALLTLGIARGHVNRDGLRRDMERLLSRYYGKPLGEIAVGPLLREVLAIVRRHQLQLPANMAVLIKVLIMSEGLGARLDPAFRLTEVLEPYARRLIAQQYAPRALARRLRRAGLDAARTGLDLPVQLRRVLDAIERGDVAVGVRPDGFEPLVRRMEQTANRLVLAMLASAFIVGLAVLLSVYEPPGREALLGALFAAGFLFASALGVYLAWGILRSGRRG